MLRPEPPPCFFDSFWGVPAEQRFQVPIRQLAVEIAIDPPRLVPSDWMPDFPAFLKLGAKSRRDGGLRIVQPEQPFADTVARMLARPGPVLARYLAVARQWRATLDLTVFRYRDFTDISEARWHWRDGVARPSSRCLRGRSAGSLPSDDMLAASVAAVAAPIAPQLIVDLAIEADGRVSVLEVNPWQTAVRGDA